MTAPDGAALQDAVAAELTGLADLLEASPATVWDAPTLCDRWRVRELVAHLTMAARWAPPAFQAELRACGGDFTVLSDRIAERDGRLPVGTLLGGLRDPAMHAWVPPGGGPMGALVHAVVHGLDVTIPLGVARPQPDPRVLLVLDHLTAGGGHAHFGVELDGLQLRATDADWTFGEGTPLARPAAELVLRAAGRDPGSVAPEA